MHRIPLIIVGAILIFFLGFGLGRKSAKNPAASAETREIVPYRAELFFAETFWTEKEKGKRLLIKACCDPLLNVAAVDVRIVWLEDPPDLIESTRPILSGEQENYTEDGLQREKIYTQNGPLEIWVKTKEELEYWENCLKSSEGIVIYPYSTTQTKVVAEKETPSKKN